MAPDTPDIDLDEQEQAEVFDETHLDEDAAEFVTLEEMPDVYDATRALGDSRDLGAQDADELEPEALDDEDLEDDEDVDDDLVDELEDEEEDGDTDEEEGSGDGVDMLDDDEADIELVADLDLETDPGDEDEADYESDDLSDDDLEDLGYLEADEAGEREPGFAATDDGVDDRAGSADSHQEELLDEGVEETFPASDPVSVKRIT